ncbi:hypothetical protein FA15DRAFT_666745 [Coprinopsis marcescibilis]|uniref:FHA domain-containing protein n=1 Tax=Coprinopsis marcescibilis TaxID=230819 RepID=A0A5C3LEU9_COPMA|nr:hypothetical protein FA15DRAFT_666745 [Coprinopsis marcescibilis]
MDTRTRTSSPAALANDDSVSRGPHPPPQDKISAYYSLVFPHFTFYIQTLSISIGRRCAPNPNAAGSSTIEQQVIDVDLGALKSVSRLHAKIEYDQDEDRFVLAVIGRNGAWVDGVWAAAGTRAPLGERSQIQIASRTFHFVLPPPPPPEDSPSPSSQSSSNNRPRSPSVEVEVDVDVDVTSISPPSSQPSHSPVLDIKPLAPSPEPEPEYPIRIVSKPEPPPPELPNSNNIGKSNKSTSKKRKKGEVEPAPPVQRPKPEDIPPKPPLTYAQLICKAIKDIGGKATLQEICTWIMTKHEYYRWADGAWMSSVRHNLSSGRAFIKMERCGGDRGKGFFWSVDEKYAQQIEKQEIKAQQAAQAAAVGGKEGTKSRKKDKNAPLEPALKRSIKGEPKGTPLPPPLTSTPLAFKTVTSAQTQSAQASGSGLNPGSSATAGVFTYPTPSAIPSGSQTTAAASTSTAHNPYAALTQWNLHPLVNPTGPQATHPVVTSPTALLSPKTAPVASTSGTASSQAPAQIQPAASTAQSVSGPPTGSNIVPDVHIPIILGPIPATHPDYAPGHPNNSVKEGYMVLHERKLILDPDVFSGLTKENLAEIEKMGARGALVVLTGHMVKALKERRAKERNKDKANRRPKGSKKEKRPMTAPFTNAPLERRSNVSSTTPGVAASTSAPAPAFAAVSAPLANAPQHPAMGSLPPPPPLLPQPVASEVSQDPGSPIINIEDSDDEGPATKRRKLDDGASASASTAMVVTAAS